MTNPAQTPQPDEMTTETPATDAAAAPESLQAARIAALEAELADTKDKWMRALAEADNVRKRAERNQIDTTKFAIAGFARDLLDVSDNLRRALDNIKPEQRAETPVLENLFQGIEATDRVMQGLLEKHGIRKIAPTQGAFDPNHHEVMFEADVPGKAAGEIIQLIEAGYMIHERLLRPARVGVAKGDPNLGKTHHVDTSA